MTSTAILASPRMPDWFALKLLQPQPCAEAIKDILGHLEGMDRACYAIRGEALRLFDERELYRLFVDPASPAHSFCTCTFRWLQVYLPDSARYCQESLVNSQRLCAAIPLEERAKMPRANLRILEGVSEGVQRMPEIHKAAQEQTEKQFARTVNHHGQHIEPSERLVIKLPAGDMAEIYKALDRIGRLTGFTDRTGQLLAWAIDYNTENDDVEVFNFEAVS